MGVYLLRAKWGPEAFKGVLANPAGRRGPVEKLMAANKLTLRDMFTPRIDARR